MFESWAKNCSKYKKIESQRTGTEAKEILYGTNEENVGGDGYSG